MDEQHGPLEREVKIQHEILQQNLRLVSELDKLEAGGSQIGKNCLDGEFDEDLEDEN